MKKHRIGVRVSTELHALLAAAGDVSAATRALSILGTHAVGYELGDLRDEAASLLAAPLDPPLRTALRGLLVACSTSVPPGLNHGATPVEPLSHHRTLAVEPLLPAPLAAPCGDLHHDDPLARIGIEV
jgi:hypothetical protein